MKETIDIQNFGPIKSFKIDLKKLNILIGAQGSGKSTVAKVIGLFKEINFLTGIVDKSSAFKVYNIENYFRSDTSIKFSSDAYNAEYKNGQLKVNFLEEHVTAALEYKRQTDEFQRTADLKTREQRDELFEILRKRIGINYYIPTERSMIPYLSRALDIGLPPYLIRFIAQFESARTSLGKFGIDFLNLKYSYETKTDFVEINKKKFKLREVASGFQSLIPLLSIIERETNTNSYEGLFLIEEPELNLFPETQFDLIKYLVSKCIRFEDRILMTTHSPYILTSLNNLMYAYQVGKANHEKTTKIIEEKYWLNPIDVSAYMMLPDGTNENIFDRKEGLIKAEKIDDISRILNDEFNTLLNIEFETK